MTLPNKSSNRNRDPDSLTVAQFIIRFIILISIALALVYCPRLIFEEALKHQNRIENK